MSAEKLKGGEVKACSLPAQANGFLRENGVWYAEQLAKCEERIFEAFSAEQSSNIYTSP